MSPRKKTTEAEVAAMQEELTKVTSRRRELRAELEAVNTRAKELNIALLRAGTPRSELIGRPFTAGYLTQVQAEAGLTRRQKETGT